MSLTFLIRHYRSLIEVYLILLNLFYGTSITSPKSIHWIHWTFRFPHPITNNWAIRIETLCQRIFLLLLHFLRVRFLVSQFDKHQDVHGTVIEDLIAKRPVYSYASKHPNKTRSSLMDVNVFRERAFDSVFIWKGGPNSVTHLVEAVVYKMFI